MYFKNISFKMVNLATINPSYSKKKLGALSVCFVLLVFENKKQFSKIGTKQGPN